MVEVVLVDDVNELRSPLYVEIHQLTQNNGIVDTTALPVLLVQERVPRAVSVDVRGGFSHYFREGGLLGQRIEHQYPNTPNVYETRIITLRNRFG